MLKIRRLKPAGTVLGLGWILLSAPSWAANQGRPGTINYVEGQVRLDGQTLTPNTASAGGSAVDPGQVLETQQGKVEVLLTPGVFLRLGSNSAIRMDSPALTDTRVAVLRGEAMVEVDQLYKENHLQVLDNGATSSLVKKGVYAFDANPGKLQVFDGEAKVDTGEGQKTVKKGHEVLLNGSQFQEAKLNRQGGDDLYNWSNLRSEYLSEASIASARTYVVDTGGWYGGGWYWNGGFGAYSFLPGDGFLYSPFGWGFYSPGYAFYAPVYGGYYGRGYRGVSGRGIAGINRTRGVTGRSFAAHGTPAFRGGGFGGGMGSHGGGFGGHR